MPREPDLALTSDPDPADVTALHDLLSAFNAQTTGIDDGRMFAIWLRAPSGAIAGGCCGWTWGGTCYVDTLFLPPALRRRGLGSRLLADGRIHRPRPRLQPDRLANPRLSGAMPSTSASASPAPRATADYPRGHAHLTMVKPLPQAAATGRRQLAQE